MNHHISIYSSIDINNHSHLWKENFILSFTFASLCLQQKYIRLLLKFTQNRNFFILYTLLTLHILKIHIRYFEELTKWLFEIDTQKWLTEYLCTNKDECKAHSEVKNVRLESTLHGNVFSFLEWLRMKLSERKGHLEMWMLYESEKQGEAWQILLSHTMMHFTQETSRQTCWKNILWFLYKTRFQQQHRCETLIWTSLITWRTQILYSSTFSFNNRKYGERTNGGW